MTRGTSQSSKIERLYFDNFDDFLQRKGRTECFKAKSLTPYRCFQTVLKFFMYNEFGIFDSYNFATCGKYFQLINHIN